MSLEDIIYEPQIIVLGVLGNRNKITETELQDNALTLILQELGRMPDRVLIPSEGNSSIFIQEWAESLHIKTQVFQADWVRNGRIAQIIRDDRIQKECTHSLIFLSPKSNKPEKLAEKMAKKGKTVFTLSSNNQTLEVLCSELEQPKASKPSRKSDKGTKQTLLKYQKKEEC